MESAGDNAGALDRPAFAVNVKTLCDVGDTASFVGRLGWGGDNSPLSPGVVRPTYDATFLITA